MTIVPMFWLTPQAQNVGQAGWLAGCWVMTRGDGVTEEHWMKPAGGSMLGMSRSVRGGKTAEFEFLQIRRGRPGNSPMSRSRQDSLKRRFQRKP